jgi:hypothetical protein
MCPHRHFAVSLSRASTFERRQPTLVLILACCCRAYSLASLPPKRASFIYEAVRNEAVRVSTHRHGCCVLQRCLDHAVEQHREPIIAMVVHNAKTLVLDPFGNYVVQYVLELKQPELTRSIARSLQGSFAELSLQKFSSNVIEKCLHAGDGLVISIVAQEITSAKSLGHLLHDPFANYVVQTCERFCRTTRRGCPFCDA